MNTEAFQAHVDRALGGDKDAIAALPAAAHRFLAMLKAPNSDIIPILGPRAADARLRILFTDYPATEGSTVVVTGKRGEIIIGDVAEFPADKSFTFERVDPDDEKTAWQWTGCVPRIVGDKAVFELFYDRATKIPRG